MKIKPLLGIFQDLSLLRSVLLVLLFIQMTGCRSEPERSTDVRQQTAILTTPPDMARVYIFRPKQLIGFMLAFNPSLDYQKIGSLTAGSCVSGLVPPGEHDLGVSEPVWSNTDGKVITNYLGFPVLNQSDKGVHFAAEAGKTYFIRIALMRGFVAVSEAEGQASIKKFKPHPFEYQNQKLNFSEKWSHLQSGMSAKQASQLLGDSGIWYLNPDEIDKAITNYPPPLELHSKMIFKGVAADRVSISRDEQGQWSKMHGSYGEFVFWEPNRGGFGTSTYELLFDHTGLIEWTWYPCNYPSLSF